MARKPDIIIVISSLTLKKCIDMDLTFDDRIMHIECWRMGGQFMFTDRIHPIVLIGIMFSLFVNALVLQSLIFLAAFLASFIVVIGLLIHDVIIDEKSRSEVSRLTAAGRQDVVVKSIMAAYPRRRYFITDLYNKYAILRFLKSLSKDTTVHIFDSWDVNIDLGMENVTVTKLTDDDEKSMELIKALL